MPPAPLHLAVALDGAGFHPAAWRHPSARPHELFRPTYWADLGRTAERGLLDFVTIEDAFGLQSTRADGVDSRIDQVRGRLEASAVAAFVASRTSRVGIVPTAIPTHSEPFHIASIVSTLDHVSRGRAGWRPQVTGRRSDAAHVGRRIVPRFEPGRIDDAEVQAFVQELFDEASDVVEVVRQLWDSWEDDAEIRDVATGRFIDREKLHHVDFEGRFFSVRGPSIVPRPPQGNPVVVALAHSRIPYEFAARSADVVLVTPADRSDVARRIADIRAAEAHVGRTGEPLRILADLVVVLDDHADDATARRAWLDDLDGAPLRSDAAIVATTPDDLAELLLEWADEGLDGFRLRPAVIGHDLDAIVDGVVPALQRDGRFRTEYDGGSLRDRLGLPRPPSRYATRAGSAVVTGVGS